LLLVRSTDLTVDRLDVKVLVQNILRGVVDVSPDCSDEVCRSIIVVVVVFVLLIVVAKSDTTTRSTGDDDCAFVRFLLLLPPPYNRVDANRTLRRAVLGVVLLLLSWTLSFVVEAGGVFRRLVSLLLLTGVVGICVFCRVELEDTVDLLLWLVDDDEE
jgi:hypothetical protein